MTATASAPTPSKLFVLLDGKGRRLGYGAHDPTFGVVVCPITPYESLVNLCHRLKNPTPPPEPKSVDLSVVSALSRANDLVDYHALPRRLGENRVCDNCEGFRFELEQVQTTTGLRYVDRCILCGTDHRRGL